MSEKPRPELPPEWQLIQAARVLIEQQAARAERAEREVRGLMENLARVVAAAGGRVELTQMEVLRRYRLVWYEDLLTGHYVLESREEEPA